MYRLRRLAVARLEVNHTLSPAVGFGVVNGQGFGIPAVTHFLRCRFCARLWA